VESAAAAVRAQPEDNACFHLYGVGLEISSSCSMLIDNLARDFAYFAEAPPVVTVRVTASLCAPPWERIPHKFATRITPNAAIFDEGSIRYNDYRGEALAIYDFARETGGVWSENADLLYEITYLLCLSRVGEIHDRKGIHRVHALGIAFEEKGALVLLPEAGGKSTLCLELLKHRELRLLSDDTPLLSRGMLHAFPTRIGVRDGAVSGIDPRYLRTMRRRNREPKTLVDFECFRDRIADAVTPDTVIVGARYNGRDSWIEPLGSFGAVPALTSNLIFGLGLPQVVEYFLRSGAAEMFRKATIVASRSAAVARLLARARCYRLALGRDIPGAADAVMTVLRS
jgi:hypothetical protein